ncbi:PopZ family protein [Hoeflea ulvae]|uniref:DUF2497 domain-containing protein n=1 Tax=Hoeflea ulvae TaxID=2983764 RepID=A0ABT3YHG3_9HYPH|nr:DUF2497 domain-containing protein [Hoeflea ulvae]MCY0095234.1 DUF2497 domain-containing protein [Hoeflea ulvae]
MGQAGAQREPSMEEILASIRRIIENNEPEEGETPTAFDKMDRFDRAGTSDETADQESEDDHAPEQMMDDAETADAGDVEAARAPAAAPVSLAEVATHARLVAQTPKMVEPASQAIDRVESDAGAEFFADMDDAAAEELRDALTSDEPVEAPVLRMMVTPETRQERPEAAVAAEAARPEPESAKTAQPEPAPAQPKPVAAARPSESTGQLVSLHTGEKVAAAFDELGAAIAAGQRRSFDEIAEEMLKPMLTQWLDDNLPTLVERLVREEIERVSRGNR